MITIPLRSQKDIYENTPFIIQALKKVNEAFDAEEDSADFLRFLLEKAKEGSLAGWVQLDSGEYKGLLIMTMEGEEALIRLSDYVHGVETREIVEKYAVPWSQEMGAKCIKTLVPYDSKVVDRYLKKFGLIRFEMQPVGIVYERKV